MQSIDLICTGSLTKGDENQGVSAIRQVLILTLLSLTPI